MQHWLIHWSGYDGQGIYDLYSGVFPMLIGLGFLGGVAGAWHKHNCMHGGCWRISRHTITSPTGVTHAACRKHLAHVGIQAGKTLGG